MKTQKTCECCGQTIRAERKARAVSQGVSADAVDTSSMTNAQMFAHYKATSPADDVAFFCRVASLSPGVRLAADQLLADVRTRKMSRADVFARLLPLQAQWRTDRHFETVIAPKRRIERGIERARARQNRQASRVPTVPTSTEPIDAVAIARAEFQASRAKFAAELELAS